MSVERHVPILLVVFNNGDLHLYTLVIYDCTCNCSPCHSDKGLVSCSRRSRLHRNYQIIYICHEREFEFGILNFQTQKFYTSILEFLLGLFEVTFLGWCVPLLAGGDRCVRWPGNGQCIVNTCEILCYKYNKYFISKNVKTFLWT